MTKPVPAVRVQTRRGYGYGSVSGTRGYTRGEPYEQDFISKLKHHLLPCIKSIHLHALALSANSVVPGLDNGYNTSTTTLNHVLLKGNHIYQHNVFYINYTTYDIHRNQDTFNSNSSHCNIMMLLAPGDTEEVGQHCFCYACIVGAYHTNVQYIGPGLNDNKTHRLDFLHV